MGFAKIGMKTLIADAEEIIREMQKLLENRHHQKVTRRAFLTRWGKLRASLNATPEYLRFKHEVTARSGGWCEQKGCKHTGNVVHHKVKVSWCPALALRVSNGMHVCHKCHQIEHPTMRLSA